MDIKELKALFKLCRAQGVTELDLNGLKVKFGDLPMTPEQVDAQSYQDPVSKYANFPSGELTPDQLAFYSAGGLPDNDPENKEAV